MAQPLRTIPSNRTIEALTYDQEKHWNGPFWFIQATDTQLGMIDSFTNKNPEPNWQAEMQLCERLIQIANNASPKPRFLIICGDMVDATPTKLRPAQIEDFKKVFAQLDETIKLICVCGNHDIGDRPTPADIEDYKRHFGDDYFVFWLGGVKFFVLNSQLFVDDQKSLAQSQLQQRWLDEQLVVDAKRPWKHLIGFQHTPPFLESADEQTVFVPGSTTLPFNFPDKVLRRNFLTKLKDAGVSHLFCGHYHRNAGGVDGSLEVVVTSAVGCQLGREKHGFRTVVVTESRVRHKYVAIQDVGSPLKVDLDQND